MRTGFVTCVQLGLDCIEAIYDCGGTLDALFTLEDDQAENKSGRIHLDDFAAQHDVPLAKSRHVSDDAMTEAIAAADLDWLFIIGWSQIAKPVTLQTPRRGCLGIHPTLLPTGRGRAAIPWAILKGLDQTGVTMFKLDSGVDTGPIVAQETIPLDDTVTATDLYRQVGEAHKTLMRQVWPQLVNDELPLVEQDHSKATEWPGRKPSDGEILPTMTVSEVDRLVRAVTHPYPGAFLASGDGATTIVWSGSPDTPGDLPPLQCADGQYWPHETETKPV